MRLVILAALGITILILFYTSRLDNGQIAGDQTGESFYQKTMNAMNGRDTSHGHPGSGDSQKGTQSGTIPADRDGDGDIDADDDETALKMQERLKAAEQKAKEKANEKGGLRPDPPRNVVGVGSSADGQDKKDADPATSEKEAKKTEEEKEAESTLSSILKKSPVIIFSKTFCPFSKRAKGLLLDKYVITPQPYVVELDEHPMGPYLQDELEEKTGRRTVPNILINGVSIGGSDEIVDLDTKDKLIGKFLDLGNKRVDIAERLVPADG